MLESNIELLHNTYKTTKYGCCGSEKFCEIYNYKNKQIIAGKGKIITGFIPNSSLTIYASFTQNLLDSTDFGTIHYSTTTEDKYDIKLKSNKKRNAACDINAEIAIQTNNKRDKFDANENSYTLWSLDKIENENDIENLTIQIQLQSIDKCIGKMDSVPLKIPIIQGKPFGKDIKIQEMIL